MLKEVIEETSNHSLITSKRFVLFRIHDATQQLSIHMQQIQTETLYAVQHNTFYWTTAALCTFTANKMAEENILYLYVYIFLNFQRKAFKSASD